MRIDVYSNIDKVIGATAKLHPQFRFAAAKALTATVAIARRQVQAELPRWFDRPTLYTLRSVKFSKATKNASLLAASVYFEGTDRIGGNVDHSPAALLQHQFYGGVRKRKRLEQHLQSLGLISPGEYVVPTPYANFDEHGNMSRGQVAQLMSQLRLGLDPYSWKSKSARSRRNVKRSGRIFWSRGGGLARGAWIDRGGRNGLRPLLLISKAPTYKRRVDWSDLVRPSIERHFDAQLDAAWRQALATAR